MRARYRQRKPSAPTGTKSDPPGRRDQGAPASRNRQRTTSAPTRNRFEKEECKQYQAYFVVATKKYCLPRSVQTRKRRTIKTVIMTKSKQHAKMPAAQPACSHPYRHKDSTDSSKKENTAVGLDPRHGIKTSSLQDSTLEGFIGCVFDKCCITHLQWYQILYLFQ